MLIVGRLIGMASSPSRTSNSALLPKKTEPFYLLKASLWLMCFHFKQRENKKTTFFLVCMPLRSREVITIKRTYIAIIILNASTVIFNLPFWLTYEVENGMFFKTAFTSSWFFESFYSNTPELIIFHLLPFIVIICGNIAIMIALRKFNKRRRDMQAVPGIDAKEISLTKVTLTIIGLYLITNLLLVKKHILNAEK